MVEWNSLTLERKLNMLGLLQREGYPKQRKTINKGNSYAIFSNTTNKKPCATDHTLGCGVRPYLLGGVSIQQSRFFYLEVP